MLASNFLNNSMTLVNALVDTEVAGFYVTSNKADITGTMCLWNLCLIASLKTLLTFYETSRNTLLLDKAFFPFAKLPMML